jgi:hypothetical protein
MQSEESDVAMVFSVSIKQFDALAQRRLSLCSLRFRRENRLAFFGGLGNQSLRFCQHVLQ